MVRPSVKNTGVPDAAGLRARHGRRWLRARLRHLLRAALVVSIRAAIVLLLAALMACGICLRNSAADGATPALQRRS
jgi:hypothetical protein